MYDKLLKKIKNLHRLSSIFSDAKYDEALDNACSIIDMLGPYGAMDWVDDWGWGEYDTAVCIVLLLL